MAFESYEVHENVKWLANCFYQYGLGQREAGITEQMVGSVHFMVFVDAWNNYDVMTLLEI